MFKKKFILELDEVPKLLFISADGKGRNDRLYVTGKEVTGTRSIHIHSAYDDATTHEVEYLTLAVKSDEESE